MAGGRHVPPLVSLRPGSRLNCGFMEYQPPQKNAASRIGASTVARKIAEENIMSETVVGRTAECIGESAGQALRASSAVADTVKEGQE
jgi:hypothetical protein